MVQLAQTTMRSEIGKITLDKTFEERETLNHHIGAAPIRAHCWGWAGRPDKRQLGFLLSVEAINHAAEAWGLVCLRYEIRDIAPPPGVKAAMELQAEAERRKRAQILESEGEKEAKINRAEGEKRNIILNSEAAMMDQVNRAKGEAEAIRQRADATATGTTGATEEAPARVFVLLSTFPLLQASRSSARRFARAGAARRLRFESPSST